MKKLLSDAGIEEDFTVVSRATSDEEIICGVGNPIYPPAREKMREKGIPYGTREATQLRTEDGNNYDLFIGMDSSNIRNMHRILGVNCSEKIKKLMDYTGRGGDVADPWYTGDFEQAFNDIYEGCTALLKELRA